jgi:hypothetical protein
MSHYSLAHSPATLLKWCRIMANHLAARYPERSTRYPVFCYRGLSGTATATALMLSLTSCRAFTSPYAMLYSRKESEQSHGDELAEYTYIGQLPSGDMTPEFVFVDDSVSSGATMAECGNAFQRHFSTTLVLNDQHIMLLTGFNGCQDLTSKSCGYRTPTPHSDYMCNRMNTYFARAAGSRYQTFKALWPIMVKEGKTG